MTGTDKENPAYTTADLRKYLGDVLGKAHHAGEIVRVLHHKKPYAAVVSDEDADLIEEVKRGEAKVVRTEEYVEFVRWQQRKHQEGAEEEEAQVSELVGEGVELGTVADSLTRHGGSDDRSETTRTSNLQRSDRGRLPIAMGQ